MLTKPFNEEALWKSCIQKANYPVPKRQPEFVFPETNWLTGIVKPTRPSLSEELAYNYSKYSESYWQGVKQRQREYRKAMKRDEWTRNEASSWL